ncbi:SET domain containing protein [Pandoraea anapnoica]|uniref:SET domain containing protein n=1 Tax=Pandoraea anapnoica TaxID=2508301 RepID=A0A5E5ACE3_9BURK|nr:SET domain-containing protein-lysine N-methyltransferase [Pandoraea anapnoica]VVE71279.1 SET domain containing protein [Pandoraea anapnoica]
MGKMHFSYLFETLEDSYPSPKKFEVCQHSDGEGQGVRTLVPFIRGQLVSRITGLLSSQRKLHTLQVNETTHLYDPHFSGMLLHSCSPSLMVDMKRLEIFALRDIEAGEFLTMDYASTEDVLARQFKCECGADGCRKWITGFRELPNREGMMYLAKVTANRKTLSAKS